MVTGLARAAQGPRILTGGSEQPTPLMLRLGMSSILSTQQP